ncbi:MAG: hypothetical protein HY042_03490 [Spirochaetia bacterium]|nr:hypothetical protein [Spirochaetia bacterium]
MEVYIPASPEQTLELLRSPHSGSGILCPETMREVREELRRSLGVEPGQPLILTGHQPLFYPPGILIKDLLADSLARALGGLAMNVVVDTDEEEITFSCPTRRSFSGHPVRDAIALNAGKGILKDQKFDDARRRGILSYLDDYQLRLYSLFEPGDVPAIRSALEILRSCIAQSKRPMDAAVAFREQWEASHNVKLRTIYVSELADSPAFKYFLEFVSARGTDFRRAYNGALAWYRAEHKIKNMAQPLPDLNEEEKELPFWVVIGGRRTPLTETMLPAAGTVYPRAIALTLFSRVFLCDLFIHGRGGGRYDRITDRLIADFFQVDAAPFVVASATLGVNPRADFALNSRRGLDQPLGMLHTARRALQFDPTRFLPVGHPLVTAKKALLAKRLEEGADRGAIHREILALNERARAELVEVSADLERSYSRAVTVEKNHAAFGERTYPFFFYDLAPLFSAVKPFATLSQKVRLPHRERQPSQSLPGR